MDILKITGAKSLWYYFKFIASACYRKQLQVEKSREQQTLNDLILKDHLLEETSLISKTDAKGKITYANDKFLEVAINGSADFILSGNSDLLVLHPFHEIPIYSPSQFLEY